MTTLAFDTCFGACSVALRSAASDGGWRLREDYREMATGHAEALLPMIEKLLAEAEIGFSSITRLAVTDGPGSFTGVRVGLSAARGFKLARGLPVVTLSSVMVLAARAEALLSGGQFGVDRAGSVLAACVDARGGKIYAQAFGGDLNQVLTPPALWAPDALAAVLSGRRIIAAGSGGALLAAAVTATGGEAVALFPLLQPHARYLALMADRGAAGGSLAPVYLREPDAKPMAGHGAP